MRQPPEFRRVWLTRRCILIAFATTSWILWRLVLKYDEMRDYLCPHFSTIFSCDRPYNKSNEQLQSKLEPAMRTGPTVLSKVIQKMSHKQNCRWWRFCAQTFAPTKTRVGNRGSVNSLTAPPWWSARFFRGMFNSNIATHGSRRMLGIETADEVLIMISSAIPSGQVMWVHQLWTWNVDRKASLNGSSWPN